MQSWIAGQVLKEMKAHPITLFLVLASVAAVSWGFLNLARASEVSDLKQQINEQSKFSECRWLSEEINNVGLFIYVLERDGGSSDWIREKKKELDGLNRRYQAKTCSSTNY